MESKNEYPLVSIGVPTYNRNIGILKTLDSIWQQKYPNLEIIISDNCSTDNTPEVIESLVKEHPDIKHYRQESNVGMIPNFEFVRRKATGKYFMWVADDDRLEPGILDKYVSFLEKNPEYSIVSGEVRYWLDDVPDFHEKGFNFEQNSQILRVVGYYFKVIYGGMVHGMMRRELTERVKMRKIIGNDYHFVANLAYLGKIKNFDFVGYNKNFGGTSKSFKQYAQAMGDSKFAGNFPHIKMACDAFEEVMYKSSVYSSMPALSKLTLAISSFSGVFLCYYGRIFPFAVAGKIKRFIQKPFRNNLK
jgi:glycosyltransferase involved in cell wall biosynthesis